MQAIPYIQRVVMEPVGARPPGYLALLALWLMYTALTPAKAAATIPLSHPYAIQLAMSDSPPRLDSLPDAAILRRFRLYVTRAEKGGRVWYRLRAGFFATPDEARRINAQVRPLFPGSWILKVPLAERRQSLETALRPEVIEATGTPAPTGSSDDHTADGPPAADPLTPLMEEARRSIANGDYARAIRIYTRVLQSPDNPYMQDAREYLGLARERNGQTAHAKAEYETYLKLYPDGPGAARVRQRLAGLITARQAPRDKLPTNERDARPMTWRGGGNFSQYYRRDVFRTEGAGDTVSQSALVSDLDLSGRGRSENYDIRARFNGGYSYDFLSDGENLTRISSLYVGGSSRNLGASARLGRQTRGSGGVFERFDGLFATYQTGIAGKIGLVGGYPVESSTSTSINSDKVFYGLSTDLGTLGNDWNYSLYTITQHAGRLTDRQAVGGEARFFASNRSLLALIDYDVYFRKLNILSVLGNWGLDNRMTYHLSFNLSRSPFLTTSNALAGQGAATVGELLNSFTEEEIKALAVDRTALSRALTVGVSRPLHEKLQLNGDVTISALSGTPASGGVPATDGTGNEFLYSLQLIGNSLLRRGDLAIVGVIYSDASTTESTTLTVDTRYPVNDLFRVNPRVRVDKRTFKQDGTTQWTTAPSLRLDYRRRRNMAFEADIGAEWSSRELATMTEKSSGYFVNLGYNLTF